jgi:hypothetical protein
MKNSDNDVIRQYALRELSRYWPRNTETIRELPIAHIEPPQSEPLPPTMDNVALPTWAKQHGVDECLLIPSHYILAGEEPVWQNVDYWGAIFWFLNASAEQAVEEREGPIHSYSFRLKDWDSRIWERAWVNRIALFLREWAAKDNETETDNLFDPPPKAEIILTHDVDAISKTLPIRIKQAAFHTFNSTRALLSGRVGQAGGKLIAAGRSAIGKSNYWCFDRILKLESRHNLRSVFHFYAGMSGGLRSPKSWLLDPGYHVNRPPLAGMLHRLYQEGWTVGLHPSFNSFAKANKLRQEREQLEAALQASVTTCRQHWLRFSWADTWKAQEQAGLKTDCTLGFNDRPAFRNGAALRFHPWCSKQNKPLSMEAMPLVLMDSHLFDYAHLTEQERERKMRYWLNEIHAVGGVGSVVWHQRVMSDEYGWGNAYERLLEILVESS